MASKPNTVWITVTCSGNGECDGLYRPSTAPEKVSESGTKSELGYWNGKMAWDRDDGKAKRSPSLSYSNSYKAWRLARLDGHLAYTIVNNDDLPTTDFVWDVYRNRSGTIGGEHPAPSFKIYQTQAEARAAWNAIEAQPSRKKKPNVVFVLGGPGAGKGTMCELAQQQLGWEHLSAGDLLRAERSSGSAKADMINEIITAGKIVPTEVTVGLIKVAMEKIVAETGHTNFLIDGFPRNLENHEGWKTVMGDSCQVAFMLFFECPLPVLEQRILGRAKWSGRSDDNVESLRKRFTTYKDETMPIVEVFRKMDGHKCIEVDSSKPREEVYALVKDKLGAHTDAALHAAPLTERSEVLLGLRPWPKKAKTEE